MLKRLGYTVILLCGMTPGLTGASDNQPSITTTQSNANLLPDRRKEQFSLSPGYAVFPYPYILPGIGEGIGLVGGYMNMANTTTDAYGIVLGGQVEGVALGMADFHILPKTLILDLGYSNISKVQVMSYSKRGMDTDRDDYRLLDLNSVAYFGGRLTASFLERRFEMYSGWYKGSSQLDSSRDNEGHLIVEADNAKPEWGQVSILGMRLDLTDDYADPRRGARLDVSRYANPKLDSGPDYYIMDYNLTGYLPVGKRSTWVFNLLRSDAHVTKAGETDPSKIQALMGVNCNDPTLTAQEAQFCNQVVDNTIANNRYGTATSLGGFSRLRSYAQGRYQGAHTVFFGTELRLNLTDESTPFDIFIMRDVRTAIQMATFFEIGSTADQRGELGHHWRESYGVGLRFVTASGAVFRGDIAYGHDGLTPQIFIGYPWEL